MATGIQSCFGQQLGCMTTTTAAWQPMHDAGSSWDRVFYEIHLTQSYGGTNFSWTTDSFPAGNCYFSGSNSWNQLRSDTKYVVCFHFPPMWLTGQWGKWVAPTNWTTFENFMVWVGTQINTNYCGAIEIMNEPYLNWSDSSTNLVRYLKVAARGLKKGLGTTSIPIIGPCNSVQQSYFDNFTVPYIAGYGSGDIGGLWTDTGGGNNLTGISEHDYPNGGASIWAQRPEGSMLADLQTMISTFQGTGLGALPIYITEMGWSSSTNDVPVPVDTYPDLTHYTTAQLVICAASGINLGLTFAGEYSGYGLLTNGVELSTYYAFKQALKWLAPASNGYLSVMPFSGGNQYVARFTLSNSNQLIAVWCDTNSSTYTIPGNVNVIAAEDWEGNPVIVGPTIATSTLMQYIETTIPLPAPSPLMFEADFDGVGGGTGGATNLITFGGKGVLIANGNIAARITNTNPFTAGGDNYLNVRRLTASGGGVYIPATFTFASNTNSWTAWQGTNIPNPNPSGNGTYSNFTALHAAFDCFFRINSAVGGTNDDESFRPVDGITWSGGGADGLQLNLNGLANGSLVFSIAAVHTNMNPPAIVNLAQGPGVASDMKFGDWVSLSGGNIVQGQTYHVGFTLNTDANGLTTAALFVAPGTEPINTAINQAVSYATFNLDAASVGIAFTNQAWNFGVGWGDNGIFNIDYSTTRLYDGVPGVFAGLGQTGFLPPVVSSGQITLSWTNTGTLLWSTNVTGPWTTNASGISSPYSEPLAPNQNRFYRLQQQ